MKKNRLFMKFVVDERPYCLWDIDVIARNRELLDNLDPDYFTHIADVNYEIFERSEKNDRARQHASTLLRITYSHALETFFALLGTVIQAPRCPVGWLLKYRPGDISTIVRKVSNGEAIMSRINPTPRSWTDIAATILKPMQESDSVQYDALVKKFGELWSRFSYDFLDPEFHDEYNGAKHGFRFRAGGFYLVVDNTNSPTLTGNPIVHASSEFGMSYFKPENIDKCNFIIHEQRNNWHPLNFCYALDLISVSLKNTIAFLKAINETESTELGFTFPDDPNYFDKPWERETVGAFKLTRHSQVNITKVPVVSAKAILETYRSTTQESV